MDNKAIAKVIKRYGQLLELHGENPFRTKAIASAAFKLDKLPFAISTETLVQLSDVPGIGKSTAEKVSALLGTGSFAELDTLLAATPTGILDLLDIKGLGPKKIREIWRALGIETVGELYYACNENRLIAAKGFGPKTQEDIKRAVEFSIANQGWFLYARVEELAEGLMTILRDALPEGSKLSPTGDFRRKHEVLKTVDILVESSMDDLIRILTSIGTLAVDSAAAPTLLEARHDTGLAFRFFPATAASFHRQLVSTTGSADHLRQLEESLEPRQLPELDSEEAIYASLGLAYIEPELREGTDEVALAKADRLPALIGYADLRGALHNHSTYSDGVHTLEEMARYCRDDLRLEYLGICDHSRTAAYARGLRIEQVQEQWAVIDALNAELAPFRIFKGIESDILADGSLDYPDEILAGFDFVVASIHANLKMDVEKATARLVAAIENPYTTILGHPTGRLLLSRSGYPIDYPRVIDACAANGVVLEINANPLRLDLDWRWHRYAIGKGVLLAINPDAHRNSGFHDMRYGVHAARKGSVSAENCLNAFSLEKISAYFDQRKRR